MSDSSVEDILNELNEIKSKTVSAESSADRISTDDYSNFFGEDESFDSVDELRNRIKDEKREKLEEKDDDNRRVYLSTDFILEENEVIETLKRAGIYKTQGNRAILYTIIMAFASVGFFLSCIYGNNYNWLFFSILCVVIIGAIWLVPMLHLKKLARENTTGDSIRLKITNEDITQKSGDKEWIIPLDKTGTLEIGDEIIIIRTYYGQMFTIPKRSIDAEVYKKVLQIIKNGTEPYDI
ncbi:MULTISPECIES: hypothetical protein [unclassified Ruminococcus]|uniref:hypothetical protein n=1 Tax=unclassified Ruminococcus TaxID=2608920 RepID=UPI00210EC935|nr:MULTISPECIES: hypothetical protein [unclassified Ruminococcus]MCQ4021969.1 hypothetical protein [Ruminococcus sp. zg-924]MCQ4114505.1 hypothetical protein [Ruminococcus sp. zg-921]